MLNHRAANFRLLIWLFFVQAIFAQTGSRAQIDWEDKLYEKNVAYEDFACRIEDRQTVFGFFELRPLNRLLRICHNNCAIPESFAGGNLPPLSEKIKGEGFIAVHLLADEQGRPIFALAVNGHSLMRGITEKRACASKFKPHEEKRQRLIYFCPVGKCDQPQPVRQK